MLDPNTRHQLSDDLLRRFGAALRGTQLYSREHPIVSRNLDALMESLRLLHASDPSSVIGLLGDELIVGDQPMSKTSSSMGELIRRLKAMGVERITFARGVTLDEMRVFIGKFGDVERKIATGVQDGAAAELDSENIRVGRVTMNERAPDEGSDSASIRKMYAEAVSVASMVWENART